jgi:hypothetical protein
MIKILNKLHKLKAQITQRKRKVKRVRFGNRIFVFDDSGKLNKFSE